MDILTGMCTYVAVVAAGSFTGGAERLGIARALTSKYVGQLEAHLGVRLLNRTTHRLNVTEVGRPVTSVAGNCWITWPNWGRRYGNNRKDPRRTRPSESAGSASLCYRYEFTGSGTMALQGTGPIISR